MSKISYCLWFDTEAEEAARFYTSLFKDGKIHQISRYGEEGFDIHGKPAGSVLTVAFEIDGRTYLALNGGPQFKFNESISLVITCEDQKEVDFYWSRLISEGGMESQCGWLKDRFGVSWQVVPRILSELLSDPDKEKSSRVMQALLAMQKLDIEKLKQAHQG